MMWSIAALHSAQVDQRGHHLVLRFDGLRIGLVGALGGHHVDQFGRQVDVGVLQRPPAPRPPRLPPRPAPPTAGPDAWVAPQLLLPTAARPCALRMRDSASWPSERVTPLEERVISIPLLSISMPASSPTV